jgi:ribosomal protein S27AE
MYVFPEILVVFITIIEIAWRLIIPIFIIYSIYFFGKLLIKTNSMKEKKLPKIVNGDIEYTDKKIWICGKCGMKNDIFLEICNNCGKEFGNNI